MDEVYSGSWLMISANDSPDAQSGFIHPRDDLCEQSCIHPSLVLPSSFPAPHLNYAKEWTYYTNTITRGFKAGLAVPKSERVICCGMKSADAVVDTCLLSCWG
jgi:hypothetical protein